MGFYGKHQSLINGEKMPRKFKKRILGKKLNKANLRKKIEDFEVLKEAESLSNGAYYSHEPFCPKCGCTEYRGTGNMVPYPEHYENFFCLRCNYQVATIDNSPFVHCLEFEDE